MISSKWTVLDGSLAAGDLALARGSMLQGNSSGVAAALAKGTANQYLSMNAGATDIEWVTPAVGDITLATGSLMLGAAGVGSAFNLKTQGSICQGNGTTVVELAKGTANQYLSMNAGATAIEWVTPVRSDLTEEALVPYNVPLYTLRAADLNALAIAEPAGGSGDHYLVLNANTVVLRGISPNSDTQTDVSYLQFLLPPEYVAAGDVKVRINCKYTSAPGTAGTVDVEAFKVTLTTGAIGADLCETAAQDLTASGVATDFVITATTLSPGDVLNIKITTVFQDSDGAVGEAEIGSIQMLLDIKG